MVDTEIERRTAAEVPPQESFAFLQALLSEHHLSLEPIHGTSVSMLGLESIRNRRGSPGLSNGVCAWFVASRRLSEPGLTPRSRRSSVSQIAELPKLVFFLFRESGLNRIHAVEKLFVPSPDRS